MRVAYMHIYIHMTYVYVALETRLDNVLQPQTQRNHSKHCTCGIFE